METHHNTERESRKEERYRIFPVADIKTLGHDHEAN